MSLSAFQTTNYYLQQAFDLLGLGPDYKTLLMTPNRELRVELAIELDDGKLGHFIGYRVQHDNSRGPFKGGLRYHPEVDLDEVRACFDCHSNETKWPWYAHVAPVSWLVQHDVDDGRKHLNFSEWQKKYKDADEASEVVTKGEMPLSVYLLLHSEAELGADETKALAQGLAATIARP